MDNDPNHHATMEKFGGTAMRTISGIYIDYLNPKPEDITIGDIIRGTTRGSRYLGHTSTKFPWTVADHLTLCVAISRMKHPDMPPEFHQAVFLHDAHEAYIADLPSPLKQALRNLGGFEAFEKIEEGLDRAIHTRFGIQYPLPAGWKAMIKEIDMLSFRIEESHYRPWPIEANFLPPGMKDHDLPRPLADEMERTIRAMNCWHDMISDRITAANDRVEPAVHSAPRRGATLSAE